MSRSLRTWVWSFFWRKVMITCSKDIFGEPLPRSSPTGYCQPIMSVHRVFNMLPWLVGCFDVPPIFRGKTHKLYPLPDMPSRSGSRATPNFGIIYCWNNNGSGWGTSCDYPGTAFSAKLCWTFAQPVTSRAFGHRRSRTGPNNSGHRLALRWLRHQGVDPSLEMAAGTTCQCLSHSSWCFSTDFRAIQGCFRGQQVLVLSVIPSPDRWLACELDLTEGWRCLHVDAPMDFSGFCSVLTHCVFQWCRAHTFHCRVLLMPSEGVHFQFVWANLPCLLQVCKAKTLVCEISLLPNAWLTRMKPEIAYLATSGWRCATMARVSLT